MKTTHIPTLTTLLISILFLAGCSTTSRLPEGEQLYVGMKDIDYTDQVTKSKKKKSKKGDGVITSLADAYEAVEEVLNQSHTQSEATPPNELVHFTPPSPQEVAAQKALENSRQKAFTIAAEEVSAALSSPPNNALLGSPKYRIPFPMGLWFYSGFVNKTGRFNKWIYKRFAKEPILVSQINPRLRTQVATNTLHNYGYFNGSVTYDLLEQKDPKKAKIAYHVTTRKLYRLDSIAYLNFAHVEDSLLRATQAKRLLHKTDPFNVINLDAERARISTLFRNNGYFYYKSEYTQYRADTLKRKEWVQLQVQPSSQRPPQARRPWYIGNTYINVTSQQQQSGDTLANRLRRRNFTYNYEGEKIPVRIGIFLRNVQTKGELYKLSEQNRTIEQLSGMGIFNTLTVNYVAQDTTSTCDTLDVHITARLDKPYDADFELNATSKSNNQVGPGAVFGLTRRNAFHGGEKVSLKLFGSYEWQTKASSAGSGSLVNSFEYGTSLSVDFPRLYFPWLRQRRFHKLSTTTFALNANWKNRANFFNMVSLGASATYTFHSSDVSKHEIVPLSLTYDELLSQTDEFREIMEQNPALYISMRNQFIPAMKYTYTYTSPVTRPNPVWWQTSISEAGNLFSCAYAMGGNSFTSDNKQFFGNPFAQFVKLTSEYRKTFNFGKRGQLATRLMGGVIYSYGNSTIAPYSEQFYIGGANSIRAFAVRGVGPGSYKPAETRYSYLDQTGDIKLEFNLEYRFPILGEIHGAAFIDAGNVWLLKKDENRPNGEFDLSSLGKDIALGTGFGLRYDLEFLVLRLDLGIALHMPYDTGKRGYYNIPKFSNGLGVHFAVGYPF